VSQQIKPPLILDTVQIHTELSAKEPVPWSKLFMRPGKIMGETIKQKRGS
jgi:hypothetical protein